MLIKSTVYTHGRLHVTLFLQTCVLLCYDVSSAFFKWYHAKQKHNVHSCEREYKAQSSSYVCVIAIICTCIYSSVYIVCLLCNACALLLLLMCMESYSTIFVHVKRC
jgi:hypothetical protein